ncbi:hypothetical protein EJB05_17987, partial [Eragrostis curvula]
MAGRKSAAVLVSLLIVAAATAAGALTICGVDQSAVDACRSYCQVGSTDYTPAPLCCKKLKNAKFDCLCSYKSMLPSDIDPDRVMQIPPKCGIPAPPNLCN